MAELSVELWAVTEIDISGVPRIAVSTSRDQAISHFLQLAYLFAHAAPDQAFKVVGDDFDAALTGLHLILDSEAGPLCVANLTRPGSIGAEPGWTATKRDNKEFASIAAEIQAALDLAAGNLDPTEVQRLGYSSAAMTLGRALAEEMLDAEQQSDGKPVPKTRAKKVWEEASSVRQYVQMLARVAGGTD